ncbi:Unknown protein sequence [Pseudomonas amygdali pv. lachrymans]|uniref:Uncharacterized protein n=1 Tax=Pseudomonas amygdali pv. lachrymans TaxID=53707 RepID=A0ABR5KRE6_PSEAV|nr:Unknown protein sequence [Pseudomonas amygdali pv. lachrymans]KPC18089.1 Unknown protein sequence [Pseudomonas amygdali pv. lachrymans]
MLAVILKELQELRREHWEVIDREFNLTPGQLQDHGCFVEGFFSKCINGPSPHPANKSTFV